MIYQRAGSLNGRGGQALLRMLQREKRENLDIRPLLEDTLLFPRGTLRGYACGYVPMDPLPEGTAAGDILREWERGRAVYYLVLQESPGAAVRCGWTEERE